MTSFRAALPATLLFFLTIYIITPVEAKELFVSEKGHDSVAYAENGIDKPWATPLKAWQEARAGDTVYFRSGTYTSTSKIWTKYYGNDGTEHNPITFTVYPGETVYLNATVSPAIDIEKNWNIIKGFNSTFPASMFRFGYDTSTIGGQVSDCVATMTNGGDNAGFVYINHSASNITVKNNHITGPGSGAHGNTAGVILFNAENSRVLNNEIRNFPIGVYYKHGQADSYGFEMAYNYIVNTYRYSVEINTDGGYIHDNIIGKNNKGFRVNESNGGPNGDNNTISHNTIVSGGLRLSPDDDGANNNTIMDNIIYKPNPCCSNNVWDYNIYIEGAAIGSNDYGDTSPDFVGGSELDSIADFALVEKSVGYLAGSDGKNIGADVSLVGTGHGPPPVNADIPEPPTGVIVQ